MIVTDAPTKLGHYGVTEKIGEGGMGVVYRAHDVQLQRDVALKVLPPSTFADPGARSRLLREARAAASLNHPNICAVHEVGEADGQAYIAMEFVEGQSLNTRLTGGPLPPEEVLHYGIQLADALAHAHEHGIVHRDFKSANVVVTREGRAKVLDFGLAKQIAADTLDAVTRSEQSLTAAGVVAGTLAYMAPEQLRGRLADARADIWALGVVLYEMATGQPPFQGRTGFELSSAILQEPPAPLPGKVPIELRAIIERCLEKQPSRRYQHAGEVRAALESLQTGAVSPWIAWRYTLARRRRMILGIGMLLVVLAAALFNLGRLRQRISPRPGVDSVAVLPLENLSGNPEQAYLSDGIHEALINDLSRLSGLRKVPARGSVMRYQGSKQPITQIADKLGVDALITGGVLRSGNRIRVTVQLIRGVGEQTLWSQRYEREVGDVLALENEIVSAIISGIKLQLNPDEQARLVTSRRIKPETYDLIVRGKFEINKLTPEGFERGLAYLNEATKTDPQEPLAWSELASGEVLVGHQGPLEGVTPAYRRAKPAALKAVELDPNSAEAHYALAAVYEYLDWDLALAEQEFLAALRLNPKLADARAHYSWLLALKPGGDWETEMLRAQQIDPQNPLYYVWMGYQQAEYRSNWDEVLAQANKSLEVYPNFPFGFGLLSIGYEGKGKMKEAVAYAEQAAKLDPTHRYELGALYARLGRSEDARRIAADLRKKPGQWEYFGLAMIYAALGERQEALKWIEAACNSRHMYTPWILAGFPREFSSLYGEPKLKDLLRRVKFPASQPAGERR